MENRFETRLTLDAQVYPEPGQGDKSVTNVFGRGAWPQAGGSWFGWIPLFPLSAFVRQVKAGAAELGRVLQLWERSRVERDQGSVLRWWFWRELRRGARAAHPEIPRLRSGGVFLARKRALRERRK